MNALQQVYAPFKQCNIPTRITIDTTVEDAEELFLDEKFKEINNKIEILQNQRNAQAMNKVFEDVLDCVMDSADRGTLLMIERVIDKFLLLEEE